MCAREIVRAHSVVKLWKNPNGLNNDARSSATRVCVALASANVARKKLAPTLNAVQFFALDF
jgi:hypothetical protein